MAAEVLYEDRWGEIIDRPDGGFVEIRWYDSTADMTGRDFNDWLATFASCVEEKKRPGALVDSVQFRMPLDRMDNGWRDENIIPRYNAAGVRRFAFLMPAGMPAIGTEPSNEGPAAFPTAYFGRRLDAVAWLGGST